MAETAEALRSRLENELDAHVYSAAWDRGQTKGIEGVVRDLLARRSTT